ncbi:MAG: putative transport system permease protein [Acidobacteriota bacterium]|nr:putative transport system permease protein [Acidobacteriota bacterium]
MTVAREEQTHESTPEVADIDHIGLFDAEIHITADTDEPGGRRRRGWLFYLHILAFVFGATLLVILIRAVGLEPIFQALGQIHYGFLFLLAIAGIRHCLRTASMRLAVAREHRRFTFWEAYTTRLAGETISFFTFTGPVLGEATKAALLRKRVPLASAVQALAVDNLLYNLSVAVFISSGACVMLATYNLPVGARVPLIAIAAGMTLVIVAITAAVLSDVMPVTGAVDFFIRRGIKASWFKAKRENFHRVEANVYDFYRQRPRSFFTMFACDFAAHATTIAEVYAILWMLGFEPSARVSYIVDSLTKVINLVFSFVPATIGVYEGGTGFILRTLGYAVATGLTIGIVRKASMIVWAIIGLGMLVRHTAPDAMRKAIERNPRLRAIMDNLVLSNMTHRPARTFVSILGVAVGVLLVAFTVGLAHGVLRERGRRESEVGAEIMVRAAGTMGFGGSQRFQMPVSRADDIARLPGVRVAVPAAQTTDKSDAGWGVRVIDGIDFESYSRLSGLHVIEGRSFQTGDEAIVDTVWKEQRKVRVGDTVKVFERDFRIVGVYEPPGGARIKVPLSTLQENAGVEDRNFCTAILVSVNNPAEQDTVAERIHAAFPEEQIIFTRDLPELYASSVPALDVFIDVVVGVAAVISMLVILLAMYTTVTERTRQIGVLKSLGMSNAGVAWVIEQEALVVSVLGVVVGVVLTLAARFVVMRATSLTVDIEPYWLGVSLLIGLLGGTLGALFPALRAARQDPVEALSYE